MIKMIAAIAAAVAALVGLFKWYVNPKRKKKSDLEDEIDEARKTPSRLTRWLDKARRLVLVFAILLAGCTQQIVLHPIEQADIIKVEQGQTITAPKDGYYLSDEYVEGVMQVTVE